MISNKSLKLIPLLFSACVVISGCSSIDVHSQDWGHPYAGAEKAVNTIEPGLAMSAMVLFIPAPFIILNVPCSILIDTILLPADLMATSKQDRSKVTYVPSH